MNLIEAKIVTMSVLGLVSIICGMIPVFIVKKMGWTSSESLSPITRTILSGILCFGGGVLMGTGFLHLLPEVHEEWQTYMRVNHIEVNLALGIVVVCAGFFLVYFIEEVVHLVVDRHDHGNQADVSLHRAVSIRGCPVFPPSESTDDAEEGTSTCCSSKQQANICQLDCDADAIQQCSSSLPPNSDISDTPPVNNKSIHNDRYGTFRSNQDHHHHHHHGLASEDASKLHGLFIIIALSLHEIFEGMAVGLQKNQSGVLQLFTAVASHKFVISFCVGLELSTSRVKLLLHTLYILTFSLVTPLGIGIGIAMTSDRAADPADSLGSLIMQGLACGTILYVAFFEILERERAKSMVGLIQWTLLVLGFLAIMGLQLLAKEIGPESATDSHINVTVISDIGP